MGNFEKLADQDYMPLRDVVFHRLREAIITGELEPGERLLEIPLSDKLGVSRTPVREAIRKLELEGLVTMVPRKGATVAGITRKHLQDVLEVRKVLEELAIELACQRMQEDGYHELEECQKKFRENIGSDDALELADIDEKFHDVIYHATDNERLVQMLANLREQMYRYRLEYIKEKDKRQMLVIEHERIIKALRQRHLEEAKQTAREHIDNQQINILRSIEEDK